MKFNLRIDDLEARNLPSAEIVKWRKDKGMNIPIVLALWEKGDLCLVKERPFNLNSAERNIFWRLAMWGQSLLKEGKNG